MSEECEDLDSLFPERNTHVNSNINVSVFFSIFIIWSKENL